MSPRKAQHNKQKHKQINTQGFNKNIENIRKEM